MEKIKTLPHAWFKEDSDAINHELRSEIYNFLKNFFIVGLDKAPNNASFICKNLAYLAGLERLKGGEFYKMSQKPGEASFMVKTSLQNLGYTSIVMTNYQFSFLPIKSIKINLDGFRMRQTVSFQKLLRT